MFCERHKHSDKGVLMTFFHWTLLAIAIADVLVAIVQLTFLSSMRLIVYDMKPPMAWSVVVGPSVVVLALTIWSLKLPLDSHPNSGLVLLVMTSVILALVIVFQIAAAKPIMDKRREWDIENEKRDRVVEGR